LGLEAAVVALDDEPPVRPRDLADAAE
jgi:hypothetical protein